MKKLALLFIVVLFASCKKDYDCTCTEILYTSLTVQNGQATPSNGTNLTWVTTIHNTKSKAKTQCEAMQVSPNSSTSTPTCSINLEL